MKKAKFFNKPQIKRVGFNEPIPDGTDPLKGFSQRFIGHYLCKEPNYSIESITIDYCNKAESGLIEKDKEHSITFGINCLLSWMRKKGYLNSNDELLVELGNDPDNCQEQNFSIFYVLEDEILLNSILRPYAIKYLLNHFLEISEAEVKDFLNQTAYVG